MDKALVAAVSRQAHESLNLNLIFNPGGSHESESPNRPGFMNLNLQISEDSGGFIGVMRRLRLEKIGSAWEKISSQRGVRSLLA